MTVLIDIELNCFFSWALLLREKLSFFEILTIKEPQNNQLNWLLQLNLPLLIAVKWVMQNSLIFTTDVKSDKFKTKLVKFNWILRDKRPRKLHSAVFSVLNSKLRFLILFQFFFLFKWKVWKRNSDKNNFLWIWTNDRRTFVIQFTIILGLKQSENSFKKSGQFIRKTQTTD